MPINSQTACKFCGSSELNSFHASERMLGLGGDFTYADCFSCGSIQLLTIPEDLSPYYPSGYYSFTQLQLSSFKTRLLKSLRMRAFLDFGIAWKAPMYGYWLKKLRPRLADRIADVGCGNGQLLYELYAGGFSDLHGYDPFIAEEKQLAPGLKLWKKRLEEADSKFDVIMMHHAFEHMEHPDEILKACFEKLNSGGQLLIRCPVADSVVWKESRELWVQLDAPRHLIIPSVNGLKLKAEQIGFSLQEVEFDSSDFQFWGTELYRKGEILDVGKVSKYFSTEERLAMQKKALQLNQEGKGDQACFYFRKPIKA
ncbi:class I SAM-dependent methyltransferase [Algoriphagus litoralis]|uniref:class I SAM-dependent methyltransferase n=1 Tax=Algoriphagus litoralis TaxID=2202829 RepID=UPI000DB9B0C9|nr:class I SAM-dependent methyltransferase [Algoriphagus litoralis]